MERIVYRKTLDVHKSGVQFTLQGFQTADKMSRSLELSLMASGDTIDFPLEQITAIMYVTTPKSTEPSINECTIKDNKIICDILPIVEEGITEIQLKIIQTRPEGASGVLATPKFALEVSKSETDEGSATQTPTYTALENAIAIAKSTYDSRLIGIELDSDCVFRANYADGTMYESDVLKELFLKGDALLSQSYARGGTGTRAGEDTDNSMYYSNVSRSAAEEAKITQEKNAEIFEEVQKHGVYTAFKVDFETGKVKYISPAYSFEISQETGELEAIGKAYTPEETIELVVTEWLSARTSELVAKENEINNKLTELTSKVDNGIADISAYKETTDKNTTDINSLNKIVSEQSDYMSEHVEDIYTQLNDMQPMIESHEEDLKSCDDRINALGSKQAQIGKVLLDNPNGKDLGTFTLPLDTWSYNVVLLQIYIPNAADNYRNVLCTVFKEQSGRLIFECFSKGINGYDLTISFRAAADGKIAYPDCYEEHYANGTTVKNAIYIEKIIGLV